MNHIPFRFWGTKRVGIALVGITVATLLLGIVLALVFSTAPLAGMLLVAIMIALAVTRFADDALLLNAQSPRQ